MLKEAPLQAYRHAGIDASVAVASPHQLIVLLFEGARAALATALRAMRSKDVKARGEALSKAAAIIDDGLKVSLDTRSGGEIAERLDALYDYMVLRMAMANAENDAGKLEEVDRLLASLEDAWRQIAAARATGTAAAGDIPVRAQSSVSYGKA